VMGDSFAIYGGGKGANQAIAAARLEAEVELFGAVGRDPESLQRLNQLRLDGVGIANVVEFDGFGGIAIIEVEQSSGQNRIVLIPGANAELRADAVSQRLIGWSQPGDILCKQLEVPLDVVERTLALRAERRMTTILNAAPFDPAVVELLPLVDYLILNEIEAGQLVGMGPVAAAEAGRVGARIRDMGVHAAVIVTLGAEGATLIDEAGELHVAAPEVRVDDTTGAGDAFVGAFSASLARGERTRTAARAAVVAGSLAVQKPGAQPSLPTLSELRAALVSA